MKRYEGKRSYGQCFVTVNSRALDPRFDLRFHSPDGFEWAIAAAARLNWLWRYWPTIAVTTSRR